MIHNDFSNKNKVSAPPPFLARKGSKRVFEFNGSGIDEFFWRGRTEGGSEFLESHYVQLLTILLK